MKKIIIIIGLFFITSTANSQVLISLIFGDKLNSDKIEFGLDGGLNFSDIQGLSEGKAVTGFNLGFYFDFKLKNPNWMINTGVLVKSPMGIKGLPAYSLNNPELDNTFEGATVERKLKYFNVPILMKYKFKNNIFVKAGVELGLLYNAKDVFTKTIKDSEDLTYTLETRDNYHRIDAGLNFGAGYRLMKGNGMNIGVQYYLGLKDIYKVANTPAQYNRGLYLNAGIPIGKNKAKKNKEAKEAKEALESK
ncbi:porin family protein [Flavobacterium sp. RSB2_4_14]|uniref:porin family protein n=1 Tax=Flavobacterium sp. RSB2_4_14 TaxID=3447665 RepID=UPI003F3C2C2C